MCDSEKELIELAIKYHDEPAKFAYVLDKSLKTIPRDQRGNKLIDYSNVLCTNAAFEHAKFLLARAVAYCEKSHDILGIAACYGNLGTCSMNLHEYDNALASLQIALNIYISMGAKESIGICITNIGETYRNIGEFGKAIEKFHDSLKIATDIGDQTGELVNYANIAAVYNDLKQSCDAIENSEKALYLAQKQSNEYGISVACSHLGIAYFNDQDYSKAIEYHEQALVASLKLDQPGLILKHYANIANCNLGIKNYHEAVRFYEKSLELCGMTGDIFTEVTCHSNLGFVYLACNDFENSINEMDRALTIEYSIGSQADITKASANLASTLLTAGDSYKNHSEIEKAIDCYEKAIDINVSICDKKNESVCYTRLGEICHTNNDYKRSEDCHKKALEIDINLGDQQDISTDYSNLGVLFKDRGESNIAMEFFKKSLEIDIELQNSKSIAGDYIDIANIHDIWSDYSKAIKYLSMATEIAASTHDTELEAKCYNNMGSIYHKWGELAKSNEFLLRALKLYEPSGDSLGLASCYNNISLNYSLLGNQKKSIDYLEKAYQLDLDANNKLGLIHYHMNISDIFIGRGEYGTAYEHINLAGRMANETENKEVQAVYCNKISAFYRLIGEHKQAIEYSQNALDIFKSIGNKNAVAGCYNNIGADYSSLGNFPRAIEYYSLGYSVFKEIQNREGESASCLNLGIAYYNQKRYDKAKINVLRAKEIKENSNFAKGEPICYIYLGKLARLSGDYHESLNYYETALSLSKDYGDLDLARSIQFEEAKVYFEDLNELQSAYEGCAKAINISDIMFGNLIEEKHKIGIFNRFSDIYKYMIKLCLQLGKCDEAYLYLEKSKSRAFLSLLATSELKPSVNVTPEYLALLDEEKKCIGLLRQLHTRHIKQADFFTPNEIEVAVKALGGIYDKMETIDPEYVFLRRGSTVTAGELLKLLTYDVPSTVMIEYYITKDSLYIFVISGRDNLFHMETVNVSETRLNKIILDDFKRSIPGHEEYKDIGESWLELSQYLIEPIAPYICPDDMIYFVPYGSLHYIPLHALFLREERIIARHSIAYLPSASLLKFCLNKHKCNRSQYEVIGVEFEEEAKRISALFGISPKTATNATKASVMNSCANKDIVHFSCHGIFDDSDPLNSGIQLHNGMLTAREIFNMKINASLVTLSACETGMNDRTAGDELIGISRAFLYAGAESILVSLWSVDSLATQGLMLCFYKALMAGMSKADALRNAQISLMSKSEYSHPYYWAPFVLIGNWK